MKRAASQPARAAALLGGVAYALLASACSTTTDTGVNQLNLDRPIDIAFACYGGLRLTAGGSADISQAITTSAQPVSSCDFRSAQRAISDPIPLPPGQEDLTATGGAVVPDVHWFGFILQNEPGTVAIARFDTKPSSSFQGGEVTILDADPLTPGTTGISVGEDPVALATDRLGCYEMTANAGSCDLSALDISSALPLDGSRPRVDRVNVVNASGAPVRSRPSAMVAQPPGGTLGVACPAQPSGLVYIAYPSCHAVAVVDVSTGTVKSSIQFDAAGIASVGDGNLVCPDECSGGASPTAGTRPVSIDLFTDPRVNTSRMVIGADNVAAFTIVELDPTTFLPLSTTQIPLENKTGTLGITRVAMSPQIGMGGATGLVTDIGEPFQFVYGVATDNTVRVADILAVHTECDTQVDPRFLDNEKSVHRLSCLAVGDALTPPRRAGAKSPGIALIADAVPTSVAIFKAGNFAQDSRIAQRSTLKGYFGIITAADGLSFVFNVDDDAYGDTVNQNEPLTTLIPDAIANQLRDGLENRDAVASAPDATNANKSHPICDDTGTDVDTLPATNGGPRVQAPPVRVNTSGFIAAIKVGELPSIRQVLCTGTDEPTGVPVSELSFAAPEPFDGAKDPLDRTRDLEFPDLRALRPDETWTLTWEGVLSQDTTENAIDGPSIRTGSLVVNASNAMSLVDQTDPFCNAGVEPNDIVQLRGCDPSAGDSDCAIGYTCFVHPDSKVPGLGACMLIDEASRLATACREFLISERRFSVARARTGELVVIPRTHVLTTTPVDGCADDAQCKSLADYALTELSGTDPLSDTTVPDTHTWACKADATRAPIGGTGHRCVETCTTDTDCVAGTVCDAGVCMESVIPPQACVNAAQRFELHASDAFTVIGTLSGYIHSIIADSGGTCVHDPNASPFQTGRIPLAPAACDPTADPRTGRKSNGTFDANPCALTVAESEVDPVFLAAGSCALANPSTQLASRQADAVRFHGPGMTLTVVDPTYPGDKSCIADRGGARGKVPLVFPGYQLSFRQSAGFNPLLLGITPAFPVKVVRGPQNSIWVMDDGDFLSTNVTVPSTQGKVFRIEPVALGVISTMQ